MSYTLTTLQEKVDWLFKNHPSPGGEEYTLREVVEELEHLGHKVSHQALWKIRVGKSKKASMDFLSALSRFFRVPLTYFSDQPVPAQEQERLKQAWLSRGANLSEVALCAAPDPQPDPQTAEIAQRVSQLSERDKKLVLAMIKQIAEMEGITDDVALE